MPEITVMVKDPINFAFGKQIGVGEYYGHRVAITLTFAGQLRFHIEGDRTYAVDIDDLARTVAAQAVGP